MNIARRNLIPIEDKFKETVFFVEANDYEIHQIWREVHKKYEYEQDSSGSHITIGYINNDPKMPVCVQFFFYYLMEYRICLYSPTSRYVDHIMVEDYIKSNWPVKWDNGSRVAMCDANNFHLCINAVQDLVKQNAKPNGITA